MDKNLILMCKSATEYIIRNKSISQKKCEELFGSSGTVVFEKLKSLGAGKILDTEICKSPKKPNGLLILNTLTT